MSSLLGFDVMKNYERLDQEKGCGVFVAIGDNSIRERVVDEMSSIDHDSNMGAYSSLAPGFVTGWDGVKIGRRSGICIGTFIKHGVVIGENCVIVLMVI